MDQIGAILKEISGETGSADPEVEEMMKFGVHLGHAKSKSHPAMLPYIFGVRNTIAVLDLVKTKQKLAAALGFLQDLSSRAGLILFVGTAPAGRRIIPEVASRTSSPYFIDRWIGGTLTNFKVILKRIEYMEKLEDERAGGGFEKYTKKERMLKEEEILRLKKNFDGLRRLKRLPDALVIVDINQDDTALREARRMKIPVVALCDTNSNIDVVTHPVPSNDDALSAVRYMLGRIASAVEQGQRNAATKKNAASGATPPPDAGSKESGSLAQPAPEDKSSGALAEDSMNNLGS